ncbi:hypothetical protein BDFB_012660 [Asbolus verrucosus]|uniref:Uncharacterized protein n=1 Tax=Asbolus verrucosus TaxID=1661398 RepID=A0A482V7E6_ASBVE|nr:hypothetical protein BDFB_012660 [Asbolus verrucosus]
MERIRQHLDLEKKRQQEEILNPGLTMTITRSGPNVLFQRNGKKIVQRRPRMMNHQGPEFCSTLDKNNKKNGKCEMSREKTRPDPRKPMRF